MERIKSNRSLLFFTVIYVFCTLILTYLISKNNPIDNNVTYTDILFSNKNGSCYSETMSFPSGNYMTTFSGIIPTDCRLVIYSGNDEVYSENIAASDDYQTFSVSYTLPRRTSDFRIAFLGSDEGEYEYLVNSVNFVSDHSINNDSAVKAFFAFIILSSIYVMLFLYFTKRCSLLMLTSFMVLLTCAIYSSSPLMADHLIYGHDLRCHTGRIDGMRNAFMDGQTIPYIIPDGFNGFGVLLFEYPWLFLLIPAFLRMCDVSMVLSYEVFLFLINIATAFVCFFSVKSVLTGISYKSDKCTENNGTGTIYAVSLISSVFYTLSTYRLSDVYIRAAMGEMLAMIFLPLLVAGLYHVCTGEKEKWYFLLIALTGILQSHILSCVLIIPLIFIVAIPFTKQIFSERRWIQIIYTTVSFLFLNIWYIVPFIRFFMLPLNTEEFTQYWVINNIVHLKNLFLSAVHNGFADDDRFTPSLGMCALVCIIVSIVCIARVILKSHHEKLLSTLILGYIICIIISSEIIPWNFLEAHFPHLWKCIHMIQFPYRFLTIAMVCIVYALGISLLKLSANLKLNRYFIPVLATVLVFSLYDAGTLMDDYESCGWVTFKTYSGGFVAYTPKDYLPAGINTETFYDIAPLINNGEITDYNKNGTSITFTYVSDEDAVATMPLNYYPCYKAVLENGEKIPLSAWEDKRMLMTLPAGNHTVNIRVKYSRTPIN